jgi:hypothetical protein
MSNLDHDSTFYAFHILMHKTVCRFRIYTVEFFSLVYLKITIDNVKQVTQVMIIAVLSATCYNEQCFSRII